jgi:hypothetical protein
VPLTEIELRPSKLQPVNLLRFPGSSKAEKRNVFLTGQILYMEALLCPISLRLGRLAQTVGFAGRGDRERKGARHSVSSSM